jgi:hypothetical protein
LYYISCALRLAPCALRQEVEKFTKLYKQEEMFRNFQRRAEAKRIKDENTSNIQKFTGKRLQSGFFDYQEAAVQHCVNRLASGNPAMLVLGTGLGKTLVARETLIRLGVGTSSHGNKGKKKRALVFCPSGLSSQMAACLRDPPPGTTSSTSSPTSPSSGECGECVMLTVKHADTTKELVAMVKENPDILIVNWCLLWDPKSLQGRDFLVVDEAHKIFAARLQRVKESAPVPSILYMTAQNEECRHITFMEPAEMLERNLCKQQQPHYHLIRKLENQKRFKSTFKVNKTAELIQSVGGSHAKVSVRWHDRPEDFIQELKNHFDDIYISVASAEAAKIASAILGEQMLTAAKTALAERIFAADIPRSIRSSARSSTSSLSTSSTSASSSSTSSLSSSSTSTSTSSATNSPCDVILHRSLQSVRTFANITPPWIEPIPLACRCLLVRYPSKMRIESELMKFPSIAKGVTLIKFTSDLSSSKRAKVISSLSQGKAIMAALKQASRSCCHHGGGVSMNTRGPGKFPAILKIGMDWFLKEMLGYIVPRLTILVTDRSIDHGYNLHNHIDSIMIEGIPSDREDLQQLLGRVSRASPHRIGHNDKVEIVVNAYRNTLDSYFLEKCNVDVSNEFSTDGTDDAD